MNDHTGMTWEEIVGSANVKDMRIATGENDTDPVRAASFDGMTFTVTSPADATAAAAFENDGTEIAAMYMGILGTAFCVSDDCRVEGTADENDDRKVTGSWYFTPMSPKEWYLGTTEDGVTTYAAETLYAQYGHWVTDVDNDGVIVVNTFARGGAGDATTSEPRLHHDGG